MNNQRRSLLRFESLEDARELIPDGPLYMYDNWYFAWPEEAVLDVLQKANDSTMSITLSVWCGWTECGLVTYNINNSSVDFYLKSTFISALEHEKYAKKMEEYESAVQSGIVTRKPRPPAIVPVPKAAPSPYLPVDLLMHIGNDHNDIRTLAYIASVTSPAVLDLIRDGALQHYVYLRRANYSVPVTRDQETGRIVNVIRAYDAFVPPNAYDALTLTSEEEKQQQEEKEMQIDGLSAHVAESDTLENCRTAGDKATVYYVNTGEKSLIFVLVTEEENRRCESNLTRVFAPYQHIFINLFDILLAARQSGGLCDVFGDDSYKKSVCLAMRELQTNRRMLFKFRQFLDNHITIQEGIVIISVPTDYASTSSPVANGSWADDAWYAPAIKVYLWSAVLLAFPPSGEPFYFNEPDFPYRCLQFKFPIEAPGYMDILNGVHKMSALTNLSMYKKPEPMHAVKSKLDSDAIVEKYKDYENRAYKESTSPSSGRRLIGQKASFQVAQAYTSDAYGQYRFDVTADLAIHTIAEMVRNRDSLEQLISYAGARRAMLGYQEKSRQWFGELRQGALLTYLNNRRVELAADFIERNNAFLQELTRLPENTLLQGTMEGSSVTARLTQPGKLTIEFDHSRDLGYAPGMDTSELTMPVFTDTMEPAVSSTGSIIEYVYGENSAPSRSYLIALQHIYDDILNTEDADKIIRLTAKLHYYMCRKVSHHHGGGSVGEWVCGGILLGKGLPFVGWKQEPWNFAVTSGVDYFVDNYLNVANLQFGEQEIEMMPVSHTLIAQ